MLNTDLQPRCKRTAAGFFVGARWWSSFVTKGIKTSVHPKSEFYDRKPGTKIHSLTPLLTGKGNGGLS